MKDRTQQPDSASRRARAKRAIKGGVIKARNVEPPHSVQPHTSSIVTRSSAYIEPQMREAMISESAYFRSAHRGFEPGHEVDDWLAAESDIDAALARGDLPRSCC
jgi:hypothetical protein